MDNTQNPQETAAFDFPDRLTRVLDAINELSKIASFDDLCKRSMELALDRLGFDRIGLCFLSDDHRLVLGAHGTDEKGRLRDEHHLHRPLAETPTVKRLLETGEAVLFFGSEILYNDMVEKVGIGDHAVARLWNGESVIGILAVDNLIGRQPITEQDLKILGLYATALGHLFTLKRTEEALRQSENRFRALFEQAAVGVAQIETGTGRLVRVNRRFCEIVGYREGELPELGLPALLHPQNLKTECLNLGSLDRGEIEECAADLRLRRKDGPFVWVHQTVSSMRTQGKGPKLGIVVIQDITERKRMEEQIQTDIREKNVLLKEIHHRVKNNMQIIVSLLNLQASRIKDPALAENFTISKDRIHSMALVHEMLHQSENLSQIDFKAYIEKLAHTLLRSFGADPRRVRLELDLERVFLTADRAVPCGLILQELLSNALKYAFPPSLGRTGTLRIRLARDGETVELAVADDGAGLPAAFDLDRADSLGMKLVASLGRDQLGGTVEIDGKNGTRVCLRFGQTGRSGGAK
jgi:PAS domain S-box-containing protein